jgi:hypothetical protein
VGLCLIAPDCQAQHRRRCIQETLHRSTPSRKTVKINPPPWKDDILSDASSVPVTATGTHHPTGKSVTAFLGRIGRIGRCRRSAPFAVTLTAQFRTLPAQRAACSAESAAERPRRIGLEPILWLFGRIPHKTGTTS